MTDAEKELKKDGEDLVKDIEKWDINCLHHGLPILTLITLIALEVYGISTFMYGTHLWSVNILLAIIYVLLSLSAGYNTLVKKFSARIKVWCTHMFVITALRVITEIIFTSKGMGDHWGTILKFVVDALFYLGFAIYWPWSHGALALAI